MARFLLLMRGDQSRFLAASEAEKREIIGRHVAYSRRLEGEKALLDGDGCGAASKKLLPGIPATPLDSPYAGSEEQVSGFYVVEAESLEAALDLARDCPALLHGESIEVLPLGH